MAKALKGARIGIGAEGVTLEFTRAGERFAWSPSEAETAGLIRALLIAVARQGAAYPMAVSEVMLAPSEGGSAAAPMFQFSGREGAIAFQLDWTTLRRVSELAEQSLIHSPGPSPDLQ